MDTPRENIDHFLCDQKVVEGRRLPAAILFADSMLRELGEAVKAWQEMAAKLQRLKREFELPGPN
jgi:hypothetical protein